MHTEYDSHNTAVLKPVAFRSEFNNFQKITPTQAWSLFFTASNEDKLFGSKSQAGRFFTYGLGTLILSLVLGITLFTGA